MKILLKNLNYNNFRCTFFPSIKFKIIQKIKVKEFAGDESL